MVITEERKKTASAVPKKNWLAEIETIVLERVDHYVRLDEEYCPKTIKVMEERGPVEYVAGLNAGRKKVIVEKENPEYRLSQLRKTFNQFRMSLEEVLGLKPLAIIPRNVWDKICLQCDLYRFEKFYNQGHVKGDINKVANKIDAYTMSIISIILSFTFLVTGVINNHGTWFILFSIIFNSGFYISMALWKMFDKSDDDDDAFRGCCLFSAYFGLGASLIYAVMFSGYITTLILSFMAVVTVFIRAYNAKLTFKLGLNFISRRRMIKMLWPNKIADEGMSQFELTLAKRIFAKEILNQGVIGELGLVKPIFPEPTREFKQFLQKLMPNADKLCLAAEEAAITIDLKQIVISKKKDPIVYMKSNDGKLIAVLGQFGEFSKEKKAIQIAKSIKPENYL